MKTISGITAVVMIGLFHASSCAAQDFELKEKFGAWSVYCQKDAKPSYGRCSTSAGAVAKDNPNLWTKVAIATGNSTGDLVMTVRTPRLEYLRNGLSLGFDGRQAVKGIIDYCSNSSCESTISLDETLVIQIGTHNKLSVEYQVSESNSALLIIDLDQIVSALQSMEDGNGMQSAVIASAMNWEKMGPVRLVLERREIPGGLKIFAWKAPYQKCSATPVKQVVLFNRDLTVQNKQELSEWVSDSRKCADAMAWIKPETTGAQTNTPLDPIRVASWALYNHVSKSMLTGVVPEDGSGIPVLPERTADFWYVPTGDEGKLVPR